MDRLNKYSERLGDERFNKQGCLMKIIEYNNCLDIVVEFQDEYKDTIHTNYQSFINGSVKNHYYQSIYNIGITGSKYLTKINGKQQKEYKIWAGMLKRCFDNEYKSKHTTYKNVTCCTEWLLFENFYEWIHKQDNFDKWFNGDKWDLDKDILKKNNKIYSPDTCELVPHNVNALFITRNTIRGDMPIGITRHKDKYRARCENPITMKREHIGLYNSYNSGFAAYKKRKEEIIKQVAQIEYDAKNITKRCYDAMMNYSVEITD